MIFAFCYEETITRNQNDVQDNIGDSVDTAPEKKAAQAKGLHVVPKAMSAMQSSFIGLSLH